MSNRLATKAWGVRGLSPAEKILLVRLADRADDAGHCFPGHQSLADDCALSERSVRRALPALAAKGHLTIAQDSGRTFKGYARFSYTVHPATPENASSVTPAIMAGVKASTPDRLSNDTGHRVHSTPDIKGRDTGYNGHPYITSLNPQGNHQGNRASSPIAGANGNGKLATAQDWQLTKDRKAIREQIREVRYAQTPDADLIDGLTAQLADINEEIRRRGKSSKAVKRLPADEVTGKPNPRNAYTAASGTDVAAVVKSRQSKLPTSGAELPTQPAAQTTRMVKDMTPLEIKKQLANLAAAVATTREA